MATKRSNYPIHRKITFYDRGIIKFENDILTFSFGQLEILSISVENGLYLEEDPIITTTADNPLLIEGLNLIIGQKEDSSVDLALPVILSADQSLDVKIDVEDMIKNPFVVHIPLRLNGVNRLGVFTIESSLRQKMELLSITMIVEGSTVIDDFGIGSTLKIDDPLNFETTYGMDFWEESIENTALADVLDFPSGINNFHQFFTQSKIETTPLTSVNVYHGVRKFSPPREFSGDRYLMIRHVLPDNYVQPPGADNVNLYFTMSSVDEDIEVHHRVQLISTD